MREEEKRKIMIKCAEEADEEQRKLVEKSLREEEKEKIRKFNHRRSLYWLYRRIWHRWLPR